MYHSVQKKKLWWKFFVVEKKDNFYDILKTHTHTHKILVWDNSNLLNSKLSIQPQKKKKKVTTKAPHNLQNTAKDKKIKKNIKKNKAEDYQGAKINHNALSIPRTERNWELCREICT